MAFPHLKGKLTVLEKNIKMKLTLLRKVSKIVHFTDFFFVGAACTAILNSNGKNNNTMLMVSKIQTVSKLINPITTLFAALFLTVVRFNLLE